MVRTVLTSAARALMLPTVARVLVLAVVGALGLALTAPVATAAEDDYAPRTPTTTHVETRAEIGDPLEVTLDVSASDEGSPSGTIDLTVTTPVDDEGGRAAGGAFGTSTRFEGEEVTVTGPVVRPGEYVVQAEFTPDNTDRYLPSKRTVTVVVDDSAADAPTDDSTDDTGGAGGLPDTGGPYLWLLLVGLTLVAAGAGAVVRARRRSDAPAAA